MLELQSSPAPSNSDVPSLNTSFSAPPPVQVAIVSNGAELRMDLREFVAQALQVPADQLPVTNFTAAVNSGDRHLMPRGIELHSPGVIGTAIMLGIVAVRHGLRFLNRRGER